METDINTQPNHFHDWLHWINRTLWVIGLIASISFVRVNYFGAEISLNLPSYDAARPMKMDGRGR